MPAPDLETLFDLEPVIEGAWKALLEARGIPTFTQAEVNSLPVPRADVQLRLGSATGHRHKDRQGLMWRDAWNYTLTVQLTTNAGKKNDLDPSIGLWRARVRMAAEYASDCFSVAALPFHTLTQIAPADTTPQITTDDDCHIVEITFTGTVSIRSTAWPEIVVPPAGDTVILGTPAGEALDFGGGIGIEA